MANCWYGFSFRRAMGVLALAFIAAVGPTQAFARTLANDQDKDKDEKSVSVRTPWGGFDASVSEDPKGLGLPLYPGAQRITDKDGGSLHADLNINGKRSIKFIVGKFQTREDRDKVRDFYQKKLGKRVTKFTQQTDDGSTVFEIERKLDQQYVSLKTVGGMTQIDLVRIESLENDAEDKK